MADKWMQKALETRKIKAERDSQEGHAVSFRKLKKKAT